MKPVGGFVEVEVELVDGEGSDLEKLGRILCKAGARRSNGRGKVLRVLRIPEVEAPPQGATTLEQLRHILSVQLRELERYDPGLRLGDDPEDLHKFRVATRRSRAMIRATKPLLGERLKPLADELKWLGGVLGPVRDFDVLLMRLREEVRTLAPDTNGGEGLLAALEEERERRNDVMLAALADERYFRLLDSYAAAIEWLPDLDTPDLRPIAAKQLRKLRKSARALDDEPSDEELHAIRIRAKRARYSAELAAVADSGKPLARYLDSLKSLQDVIGEHQDAVVAQGELRAVARAKTALAAGRLIERERDRRAERRSDYPEALAAVLRLGKKADLI
jgi:CHAD domain-containing protein